MANIYKGALELVGNTPLVEVVNVEKILGLEATVLAKLEYLNPAVRAVPTSFRGSEQASFRRF